MRGDSRNDGTSLNDIGTILYEVAACYIGRANCEVTEADQSRPEINQTSADAVLLDRSELPS